MPDHNLTLPIGLYETSQSCPLGTQAWDSRSFRYRYVQFLDAVTYTKSMVVTPASATTYKVTNDVAGGSSLGLRFAGVLPYYQADGSTVASVPTQNQFGWVMLNGYHPLILNDGTDYAVGDTIAMVATDGTTVPIAAATTTGTLLYAGWAPAVVTATTGPGFVNCFLW